MKDLWSAGRELVLDLVSTLFFLALFALTGNVVLAVALGLALAFSQIGWQLLRGKRVVALQWVSLSLVAAAGAATLFTRNPLFVMLKPSAIYVVVGVSMLEKGWMTRYMPPRAVEFLPDLVTRFGTIWAWLMFVSAALNLALALTLPVVAWGTVMTVWGLASKFALFFIQYGVMKTVGVRRYHARLAATA